MATKIKCQILKKVLPIKCYINNSVQNFLPFLLSLVILIIALQQLCNLFRESSDLSLQQLYDNHKESTTAIAVPGCNCKLYKKYYYSPQIL